MPALHAQICAALLLTTWVAGEALAQERVIVTRDEGPNGPSYAQSLSTHDPWPQVDAPLATDPQGVLHVVRGRAYHLSQKTGRLLVIDVATWTTEHTHELGGSLEPRDVAVVDPTTAYLSRSGATYLARVNLETGAISDVVDLGLFADSDGLPEMNRMIVFENRLFVQLRRLDTSPEPGPPLPPALAVVDLATEQLVDADADAPGIQPIELVGTAPRFDMQVVPSSRHLLVSATGYFHDAGGLELVDLDALESLGLVVSEATGDVGADLGAFVMVSPDEGYLVFSTDLLLSSHLHKFSLSGGVDPFELHFALNYFVPKLVLDGARVELFWPEPGGIHVFDAVTGDRKTETPIAMSGIPTDLALAPAALPGHARSILWAIAALLSTVGLIALIRNRRAA